MARPNCLLSPAKRQSRITRQERFLKNPTIITKPQYWPYVEKLLASLPPEPRVLVMDGRVVGRRCRARVLGGLHNNRAVPLCWSVGRGKKGPLPETLPQALVEQAVQLLGAEREVLLLGDGDFDGGALLKALSLAGWEQVCRTAKNVCLFEEGVPFSCAGLSLPPGDYHEIEGVGFTKSLYGPVTLVAVWEAGQAEALFLVTNRE